MSDNNQGAVNLHEAGFTVLDEIEGALLPDVKAYLREGEDVFVNAAIVYALEESIAQASAVSDMLGGNLDRSVLLNALAVLHAITHRAVDEKTLDAEIQDLTN